MASQRDQLAKLRAQIGERMSVNSPILEAVGEVGTSGSADSSSRGDPTVTTTTTGIGGTGTEVSASSSERATPTEVASEVLGTSVHAGKTRKHDAHRLLS